MTAAASFPKRAVAAHAEGFVLAGGYSSRMGRDKALIEFAGQSLIAIAIHTLQQAGLPVKIAGSRANLEVFAEVIPDTFLDLGPLAGVHAALAATHAEWSVILPVDMPLLPASLLRLLLHRAAITRAAITCMRCNGFLHPFPAILHRSVLAPLTRELQSGVATSCMKMWQKLAALTAGQLDAPAIESLLQTGQIDTNTLVTVAAPPALWLQSANTPDDLSHLENLFLRANPSRQIT